MPLWGWVVLGIVVVLLVVGIVVFNRLVSLRNRVDNGWSQIDVQLRRRYDLIPNLVSTVQGYAAHERELFEEVTAARARAIDAGAVTDQATAENDITRGLRRLPDDDDADSASADAMFFRLYDTKLLRRETKDYVPKLIAAALIAKQPSRYGIATAPVQAFAYDSLVVTEATGLDVVARLAGVSLAEIEDLNPQYLRMATPPGTESVIRVPAGTGARGSRRCRRQCANRSSWRGWKTFGSKPFASGTSWAKLASSSR